METKLTTCVHVATCTEYEYLGPGKYKRGKGEWEEVILYRSLDGKLYARDPEGFNGAFIILGGKCE